MRADRSVIELAEKLSENPSFKEFQEYLAGKILEIDTVDGFADLSVQKVGEEVKARAKAIEILVGILDPFVNFKSKKEKTTEEVNTAKKRFGLG